MRILAPNSVRFSKAGFFLAILLCCFSFSLNAGVLLILGDSPEVDGRLTLKAPSIHVEGSSSRDVAWSNVLEADFSDVPFSLPYFGSESDLGNSLPTGWTTKAIGPPDPAGSARFSEGTLTLTGDGSAPEVNPDHYFFAGMPWNGDGQWTAYLKELDPPASLGQPSNTEVVLTVRAGLDAGAGMFGIGVTGNIGTIHYGGTNYKGFPCAFPTWIRLRRCGKCLETSLSKDGKTWNVISQDAADLPAQSWVGFMVNGRMIKGNGSATISHISFTPGPAPPEAVPPGFLLTSSSVLAGNTFHISATDAGITHDDKDILLKTSQLAAAAYHPINLSQLAGLSASQGLILKNGDFLASDIENVGANGGGGMAQMSSLALGIVNYYTDLVSACVANPLHELPSDYEIRLYDGSIIRAKTFALTNGQLIIHEVGDISIAVNPVEVAQLRAGSNRIQPLISLPWKVSGPFKTMTLIQAASDPMPANVHDAATVSTASTNESAGLVAPGLTNPEVLTWAGPNREQVLVVPAGTSIEFPLREKFDALAMRVAVAPGASSNAEAKLRVLIAGKEVACSPALKAGDQPRSMRLTVTVQKSITLAVDSASAGTRLLLIDPVGIRTQNGAASPADVRNPP